MSVLEHLPPIYYINLDRCEDRRLHMEKMLSSYGLQGTRIQATDGSKPVDHLVDVMPVRLRPNEIACTISHLRAIQTWLTTSDSDMALICEDDLSFETVEHWPFNWTHLIQRLPYYWEIVQLCIIYHPKQEINVNLHTRTNYDFSAACYMMKRSYAQRLMSYYWNAVTSRWKLDYPLSVGLTSEEAVYRPGSCLSIPLFTFTNEHGSSIQTAEHVETYHAFSKRVVMSMWKQLKQSGLDILNTFPPILYK